MTFAHASSSTNPTAPSSISSGRLTVALSSSDNGTAAIRLSLLLAGYARARFAPITSSSACAVATVPPGCSLARTRRGRVFRCSRSGSSASGTHIELVLFRKTRGAGGKTELRREHADYGVVDIVQRDAAPAMSRLAPNRSCHAR